MNALNDNLPEPALHSLSEADQQKLLSAAQSGRIRLLSGDPIDVLEFTELLGLVVWGQAELAGFTIELARRREMLNH